jgi:protein-disulfide isomerase
MKKHAWKIFLAVSVILLGGSFIIANQSTKNADEGVVISDNVAGNPEATVVVREYSDLQCPACQQFHSVVKDLLEERGDQVRFEYKHFPLVSIHPFAVPAAKAAEAAGQQGKFFEYHDLLFENQQVWGNSANPTGFFLQYAEELELDTDLFRRHMRSQLIDDKIQAEFNEARDKGYTGTPTFELNGQRMQFETFEEWRSQIIEAIDGPSETTEEVAAPSTGSDIRFGL